MAYCVQIQGIISSGNNSLLLQLMNGVISSLSEVTQSLENLVEIHQRQQHSRSRGRPKLRITEEKLVQLLQGHFSIVEIGKLLGCSTKTVHRKIQEFGLASILHTSINDIALDEIVTRFVQAHPTSGQRMLV